MRQVPVELDIRAVNGLFLVCNLHPERAFMAMCYHTVHGVCLICRSFYRVTQAGRYVCLMQ